MTRTTIRRRRLVMVIEGELPSVLFELISMDSRVIEHSLVDITEEIPSPPARRRFLDTAAEPSDRSKFAQQEILDSMSPGTPYHRSVFTAISTKHGFKSDTTSGLLTSLKKRGLVTNPKHGHWQKV